jgi:sulfate permease, SulP family
VRRPSTGDVLAGVSVALVLIPQSLAYATLAGLPPEAGLYAAAIPTIVAGLLASSPYLQTGPTATTSLLTLGALTALAVPGDPDYIRLAALLALLVGAVRLIVGLVRMGVIAYLMSQPVVVAFTAAAGILIVLSQVPAVLGVPASSADPIVAAWDALRAPGDWVGSSIVVGTAALALVLGGRRVHPLFPGALVALLGGVVLQSVTGLGGPSAGELTAGFPGISLDLPWGSTASLLLPGVVIALVGFAEPAAIARHYATAERRRWDPSRELVGQGAANLASGLFGGLPIGGSFSRTALAKLAGATSRWSSVVVGLIVLASLPAIGLLSDLPRAVLGGIVIAAVVPLVNLRPLLEYWRTARLQFVVAAATFVATIATAPHVERGVLVGIGLAVAAHLYRELKLSVPVQVTDATIHVSPRGVLFYASAAALEEAIGKVITEHPDAHRIVFHLDGLGRVDLTGALALRRLADDARAAGMQAEFADVPPQASKIAARVLGGRAPVELLVEGGSATDADATRRRRRDRGTDQP